MNMLETMPFLALDSHSKLDSKFNLSKKAIFLDRDGVLNRDTGYVSDITKLEWIKKSIDALINLKKAGFLLIVITNQSGVARKYFTERAVQRLHKKINDTLLPFNTQIDAFYYCPHHPGNGIEEKIKNNNPYIKNCKNRKPHNGMIIKAIQDHNIDIKQSYLIGDKNSDIAAGKHSKITSFAVLSGQEKNFLKTNPDHIFRNLFEASQYILNSKH